MDNVTVTKMTIGQALRAIKRTKGDLAKHQARLNASITYNATKPPPFKFEDISAAINELRTQLIILSSLVAEANATNKVIWETEEISLTMAVKILAELKGQLATYKELSDIGLLRANHENDEIIEEEKLEDQYDNNGRFIGQRRIEVKTPVKFICNLTISEADKEMTRVENEFERLNNLIEQANHRVLIELPVKNTKGSELS